MYNGMLLGHKSERKNAVCSFARMDLEMVLLSAISQTERKTNIGDPSYVEFNLKWYERIYLKEEKQTYRCWKQTYGYQEERGRRDQAGVWDEPAHTLCIRQITRQGSAMWHWELYSVAYNNLQREMHLKKNEYICMCNGITYFAVHLKLTPLYVNSYSDSFFFFKAVRGSIKKYQKFKSRVEIRGIRHWRTLSSSSESWTKP